MGKYLISLSILISTSVSLAHDACFHVAKKMELAELVEHTACKDLEVGEKKTVNFNRYGSPTGTEHRYILEKTAANEYKARINLEFLDKGLIPQKSSNLGKRMQIRINNCLKEYNPKLVGPNGEKLTIEIVPLAEKHLPEYKDIKTSIIVNTKPVRRENSHYYGIESKCSTIMHELLHLMGLVDEYLEDENILPWEKECRSYGPQDSIMANHIDPNGKINAQTEGTQRFIKTCYCNKPEGCQSYSFSQFEGHTSCPPDYELSVSYATGSTEDLKATYSMLTQSAGMMMYGKPKQQLLLSISPSTRTPNSVLYPAQFRSIVYPGCKAKNSTYYKCAEASKETALKYIGYCSNKPKICSDPTQWLK